MNQCPSCGAEIPKGTLHNCLSGTLRAPWLCDMLQTQNEELKRIRELLEAQAARATVIKTPERETRPSAKAQLRETRSS